MIATALKATRHQTFSPARIAAIASNTLLELVRLKVFYFMLLFALLLIGSSAFMARFSFQEQFQTLKNVSLGAMSIFTWLLATLATAMLLPKDIEDRTLYTILAKPVPRLEYLLGKLLGVLAMLLVALLCMSALFVVVLYAQQQIVLADTAKVTPPTDLAAALREVRNSTFNINLLPGIAIIYVKAAIVATMTLLLSTFASSWIFTIIMSMMMYVIGHLQPIARDYWVGPVASGRVSSPLLELFFGLIAIAFPDFQLFDLVNDVVVGNAVALGMFLKTAGLGVGYVFIYTLVGYLDVRESRAMKRRLAILIFLGFGVVRLPIEQKLTDEHRAAFFHGEKYNLDMLQRLGQNGAIAALSGFRALVADVLWIQAHSAWERTEWGRMKLLFDTVTSLQPRCLMFWDMAAWHMAWNASVAAREDPKQPREALRIRAQREYFQIGEQYLLDGIKNNPDRPLLYDRLGMIYRDKFRDPCKAQAAYDQCARLPGAPAYAKRFAAYMLAECPGHEREAYERLVALYKMGEDEHLPTLLKKLAELQEKLSVPSGERIYTPPHP